jgi:hypothetical protein
MTRSRRGIFQPKQRTDGTVAWFTACQAHGIDDPTIEPSTHHEALRIPHWRAAMEQEFNALLQNDTWSLVPPRPGLNVIDSKWVFKKKNVKTKINFCSKVKIYFILINSIFYKKRCS